MTARIVIIRSARLSPTLGIDCMSKPVSEHLPTIATVSTTIMALESLRADKRDRALELLEIQLDMGILALNRVASSMEAPNREAARSFLQTLRDYRRTYPRRTEAKLDGPAEHFLVRAALAAEKHVSEVFGEL